MPYLFSDFWRLTGVTGKDAKTEESSTPEAKGTSGFVYKLHLILIATLPVSALFLFDFATAMLVNGVVGAMFIPILAITLLLLNNRESWIGSNSRNSLACNVVLGLSLVFFAYTFVRTLSKAFLS